jgi:murein DD-endopeptidase MepM/ murein hydrolase activator NlpD
MNESPGQHGRVQVARPVSDDIPITSPFGERVLNGARVVHHGIDFGCPVGTEIRAVADGMVNRAGYENPADLLQGYGLRIWQIATIGGVTYDVWYGHCSDLLVQAGDKITQGQVIARSGHTGHVVPAGVRGAHLHLGLRKVATGQFYEAIFAPRAIS